MGLSGIIWWCLDQNLVRKGSEETASARGEVLEIHTIELFISPTKAVNLF